MAKKGIKKAVEAGLNPVKVNMVVMKGINHNEIWDMFQFCKENGVVLQLIELLKTENCEEAEFLRAVSLQHAPIENEFKKDCLKC